MVKNDPTLDNVAPGLSRRETKGEPNGPGAEESSAVVPQSTSELLQEPQSKDADADKAVDKRVVGRARNWLRIREDGIHVGDSELVHERHHTDLPWGEKYDNDSFLSLLSIDLKNS